MSEIHNKYGMELDKDNGIYEVVKTSLEATGIPIDLRPGTYVDIRFNEQGEGTLTAMPEGYIGPITKLQLSRLLAGGYIVKIG